MIIGKVLETARLQLRPLALADAPEIQTAAGRREISDTMISVPHPYPDGEAERYVARKKRDLAEGSSITFVIGLKAEEAFSGIIELRAIDKEHSLGELSFWLRNEAWGKGYMSEAVQVMVRYGFEEIGLNRLYAFHMLRNPATGRVLEKNGFRQEGILRQRVRKWGQFEDVAIMAILREDWRSLISIH